MRERFEHLIPSVLGSTLVILLAFPLAAAAASGLPATVTMEPPAAAGGEVVEITGLDFPGLKVVELQVATSAGAVHLVDTVTADSGYFRETVTLPAGLVPGTWEVQATAPDGVTAAHRFQSGTPAVAATGASAATTSQGGNSGTDIVFLLVIAGLLAAVGGSAAYVWREARGADRQPGMGAGDDPIWSGGIEPAGGPFELTAVEDPRWSLHGEP